MLGAGLGYDSNECKRLNDKDRSTGREAEDVANNKNSSSTYYVYFTDIYYIYNRY